MMKAIEIASFFVKKGVSPLKLQKLLYYSQVWFFVKNKKSLFDDKVLAWVYGPVVYDVWSTFRFIKRSAIIPKNRIKEITFSAEITEHLEMVWNAYGHLSGADLVDLTHAELPWKNSRKGLLTNEPSDNQVIINHHTIEEFILDMNGKIPIIEDKNSKGHYANF